MSKFTSSHPVNIVELLVRYLQCSTISSICFIFILMNIHKF